MDRDRNFRREVPTTPTGSRAATIAPRPGTGKAVAFLPVVGMLTATGMALISCRANHDPSTPVTSAEDPQPDPYRDARERLVTAFSTGPDAIKDPRVLDAMRRTPRHEFVPADLRRDAYLDQPLPIGHGQTISQPSLVAHMTELLLPESTDRVLEIGTGSGYQAAVLAPLVAEVYTIEIVEPLGLQARNTLSRLGYRNIHTRIGDGYLGWPEAAPFDSIIVTCAPDDIPRPLIDQLREGGRMVIPVGPRSGTQELILLEKRQGKIVQQAILKVRFVPMTGAAEKR
jgi:protein-L-isoaspartate(D-aspartate) O-methyltransferase